MHQGRIRDSRRALPTLRKGVEDKDGLLQAITNLTANYSLTEFQKSRGKPLEIEIPGAVMDASRTFKDEAWYTTLSPPGKIEAELEIAGHLHREVRRGVPRIWAQFQKTHRRDDLVEQAEAFNREFGHLPGQLAPVVMSCVAHSLVYTRIGSAIGLTSGILSCPQHIAALVQAGPELRVSDANFDNLLTLAEWDGRIMESEAPEISKWRGEVVPPGKTILQVLSPVPHKLSATAAEANAHNSFGILLKAVGRTQEAESEYQKALEINPDQPSFHTNYANLLSSMDRDDDALHQYQLSLALDPKNVTTHVQLGLFLEKKGQVEEAEHHYTQAISLHPNPAVAHDNYGALLAQRGEPGDKEKAEEHFRTALELKPDCYGTLSNLGRLLAETGNYVEAEECLRRAIAQEPKTPVAHENLAYLLEKTGHPRKAARESRRAEALRKRTGKNV